jgi:NAD(P)H-nitrite reductase large subunit
MSASPALVIVGSGLAGHTLARSLASLGYAGSVTLLGEEHHAPYDRPPLSKEFQRGDESTLRLKADGLEGVQLISGCKVVAIHTHRRALHGLSARTHRRGVPPHEDDATDSRRLESEPLAGLGVPM